MGCNWHLACSVLMQLFGRSQFLHWNRSVIFIYWIWQETNLWRALLYIRPIIVSFSCLLNLLCIKPARYTERRAKKRVYVHINLNLSVDHWEEPFHLCTVRTARRGPAVTVSINNFCYVVDTRGQTPAESDFQILEIARKLEMYGVRFHPAADREGTKINLSVAHMGLQVFQVTAALNPNVFLVHIS